MNLPYPALHATHGGIWLAGPDGGVAEVGRGEAIRQAADTPMIMLNAPLVASRLGYPDLSGLDLLELFAFVYPARFAVPTPHGLATVLGLEAPASEGEAATFLRAAAAHLLGVLEGEWPEREGAWTSLQQLGRLRWPWASAVAARLGRPERNERWLFSRLPSGRTRRSARRPDGADQPGACDRAAGASDGSRRGASRGAAALCGSCDRRACSAHG
jgi:ATP-dependent DNA helicase DinG